MAPKSDPRIHVLIDCEKLKYPNTGLHSFSLHLSHAIENVKSAFCIRATYLIKSKNRSQMLGMNTRLLNFIDKVYFFCNKSVHIYHAPYQMEKYFPHGVKTVLTIHDLNFLYEKGENKMKWMKRLQRNVCRADYIVTISNYTKQDVEKYLNTEGKPIAVIYNGCSFYEGETVDVPQSYHPKQKFLFSLGTILPKKNFHVLPCLLVDNDYELIIAGNNSDYSRKIMEEATAYGVQERVKIIGPVSESDKDWYYRNCSAFVFPSIAEGFGLPVIESLAYGKPTFISRRTCLPEIGRDYCYYFNDEFSPMGMREEFQVGMEDFPTRDREAQIRYAHSFSWDEAARKYCEIYQQLARS